jgi:hypothetical protein
VCKHLIGRHYQYGGDDCIHLVIDALNSMGMNPPEVASAWYTMTTRDILIELQTYCERIKAPVYDGDIALLAAKPPTFGVAWQSGILHINQLTLAVDWKPLAHFSIRRSYRMKGR